MSLGIAGVGGDGAPFTAASSQSSQVFGSGKLVNLNTTGDTLTLTGLPAKYAITGLFLYDFSGTPSALLSLTLRDTASGAGNSLAGAVSGLNAIATTAIGVQAAPISSVLGGIRQLSASTLYLNVSVANGSALTCSVALFGYYLP